jgi:hypothetical protein
MPMSTSETLEIRFAICLRNEGYSASLELRKLYRVVPDAEAAARGHVRVIDESGEDYLYPAEYFVEVELPHAIEEALVRAS